MHRFCVAFLAILFTFWQFEWTVFASVRVVDVHRLNCSCKGTTACCCQRHATDPQHACHLQRHAPQTTCAWQSDDCHHAPATIVSHIEREGFLPLEKIASAIRNADTTQVVIHEHILPTTPLRDPLFVPPESFLS